jgi:hypothetical protein
VVDKKKKSSEDVAIILFSLSTQDNCLTPSDRKLSSAAIYNFKKF